MGSTAFQECDPQRGAKLRDLMISLRRLMLFALCCAALLAFTTACMLTSGDRLSSDAQPEGGNVTRSFVGAEGSEEHALEVGGGAATLQVIAIVEAQQGEAIIEVLQPSGAVALAVRSRPGDQVSRSGVIQLDDTGILRYRVFARGVRDGGYQILYQRMETAGN